TCFGAPFLPLRPRAYADLLGQKIDRHDAKVWLINTGWTGGGYGVGHRISLQHTRSLIHAAFEGKLHDVAYETDPVFGLHVPTACPG
ncbi:phosphoenolpyruvate carboxykinase (ATP), partial [Acinetobacter baumannii]